MHSKFSVSVLFFYFSIFSQCFARDFFVSSNLGNNANSGQNAEVPFQTLAQAAKVANQPGDTVHVMNGVYRNWNFGQGRTKNNPPVVQIQHSGSQSGGYITWKAYEGHAPKIQFDGAGGFAFSHGTRYIIIEGFEIEGPAQDISFELALENRFRNSATAPNNYISNRGIFGWGPHDHIIIRDCFVHDTCASGIRFNDADYMEISNCVVARTCWWSSSAESAIVFAEAAPIDDSTEVKMTFRHNVVYDNWNRIPFYQPSHPGLGDFPNYGEPSQDYILDGQGLYVTRSLPNYRGTFLFEYNLMVNNGKNGINFDGTPNGKAIMRHNTIFSNGAFDFIQSDYSGPNKVAGIAMKHVGEALIEKNIIVCRNGAYNALSIWDNSPTSIRDNLVHDCSMNLPSHAIHTIFGDPKFVNPSVDLGVADFSLRTGSPALGWGALFSDDALLVFPSMEPTMSPSTTLEPTKTPSPLLIDSPTINLDDPSQGHFTTCGRPGNCASGTQFTTDDTIRAVRCVSDHSISGWFQALDEPACADRWQSLWWESDAWGECQMLNFEDATLFCASMGARLPTLLEAEDGCVSNSGCAYDSESIWTSTGNFVLGERGVNACPPDYEPIANSRECENAALAFGKPWSGVSDGEEDSICFVCEGCSTADVRFTNGHGKNADWICKRQEDRYFAFHGCSLNGGAPTQLVDVYDSNLPIAEVSCCSLDGSTCTRKRQEDSQCFTGDNDVVKVSWIEAKSMCETQGMRLCNSQEEINKCCSSGCGYDNQLVWSGARIKPMSKHFTTCGRPGKCTTNTSLEDDIEFRAVRCVSNTEKAGWFHGQQVSTCLRWENIWWASNVWGECKMLNYQNAFAFCTMQNARLPTREEAEKGCVANSGCGFDSKAIWTSTKM